MRWVWLVLVAILVAGCYHEDGETAPPTSTSPISPTPATPTAPPAPTLDFDGQRAFRHVEAQVQDEHGDPRYRIPGTEGNNETARYIDATLSALGYAVAWHHFNATYGCQTVAMHNVVAESPGSNGTFVVFAAHYDTRPVADKDPDPAKKGLPILGANDGGSGVGVLLELARVLAPDRDGDGLRDGAGVRFLFFDGEDGGGYKASDGCRTDWILGSRAYAESLGADELAAIEALVLVDMIGDHDLKLPREGYTAADARAAPVQDEIYDVAGELGADAFLDRIGAQILDDHVPFLERKVAAVDLIHTIPGDPRVFPSWHHTQADDLSSVDAESLAIVGRTLEAWFEGRAAA